MQLALIELITLPSASRKVNLYSDGIKGAKHRYHHTKNETSIYCSMKAFRKRNKNFKKLGEYVKYNHSYNGECDSSETECPYCKRVSTNEYCSAGCQGPKGDEGQPGPQGNKGDMGPQGLQGNKGEAGLRGPKGDQGIQGHVGPRGYIGHVGPQGPQGVRGNIGPQGESGNQGAVGSKGNPGPAGPQGVIGPMGPKGDLGPRGYDGPAGPEGPAGSQGWDGPQGPQGIQGETGVEGPEGPCGPTGCAGSVGPKGDTGETGAAGLPGPKGDTGETGATGLPGQKGDTGETGAAGLPGPKGDTGATGATGLPGQKGDTGATGAAGLPGPKGDTGATGAAGLPGSSAIIPYASGAPITLTTILGGLVGLPSFVAFGISTPGLSVLGATIDTSAIINEAFSVPRTGIITDISAFFSTTVALTLVGASLVVRAQLYSSTAGNSFAPIPGTMVSLPDFSGLIGIGTDRSAILSGLSIPVQAGQRLLLVFSASASGLVLINTAVGYASAGVAIR